METHTKTKETKEDLNEHEPAPVPNKSTPIWCLVMDDMKRRNEEGIKKYGTPLQAFNGRRPLVDMYQEQLDNLVYTRQAIEEQRMDFVIIQLRAEINCLANLVLKDASGRTRKLKNVSGADMSMLDHKQFECDVYATRFLNREKSYRPSPSRLYEELVKTRDILEATLRRVLDAGNSSEQVVSAHIPAGSSIS